MREITLALEVKILVEDRENPQAVILNALAQIEAIPIVTEVFVEDLEG